MQYQDVRNILGPCVQAQIIENFPDGKFRDAKDYVSASGLKDYLQDPELALRVRVLKTSPRPEKGATAKSNMRIGKAIHCYGLEGEKVYREKFPTFTLSEKRGGEAWKVFQKENPQAAADDNILSIKEEVAVQDLGPKLVAGLQTKIQSFQERGWGVLKACPELSIFATYASGISIKVRLDALFLLSIQGQLIFMVEDVKTTSKSVTNFNGLSLDIEAFLYHLQGIVYLMVAQDALSIPQNIRQLGVEPGTDNHMNMGGQFNFLWLSKLSETCGFQEGFLNYGQVAEKSWDYWGLSAFATALVHYKQVLEKGGNLLQAATNNAKKETLEETAIFMDAPPTGRMRWSHGSYVDTANEHRMSQLRFPITEASLRSGIQQVFPPEVETPEPPTVTARPAPKKKKKTTPPPPKEAVKVEEEKEKEKKEEKDPTLAPVPSGVMSTVLDKDTLEFFSRELLRDHPVVLSGKLDPIDWKKNVRSIKAGIKKTLKKLGTSLDQEKIINDYFKKERK